MTLTMLSKPEMKDCINDCDDCHGICLETVSWCLDQGGEYASRVVVTLLQDAAEIAQASANFMIRDSDLHAFTCGATAAIAERCADMCERMADQAQMQACANACRRCAGSCRAMSA